MFSKRGIFITLIVASLINQSFGCWRFGGSRNNNNNNNNNGGGSSSSSGSGNNNNNNNGRMDEDMEAELDTLTMEAFLKCDNDGIHGLSWDEIEKCEEEFCSMLTIPCPSEEDFETFDEDGDGSLSLGEYFHHVQILKENE